MNLHYTVQLKNAMLHSLTHLSRLQANKITNYRGVAPILFTSVTLKELGCALMNEMDALMGFLKIACYQPACMSVMLCLSSTV